MKRKISLLFLTVAIGTLAYGQVPTVSPAVQMSLEDCLDYAMGNNYSRQSVQLNEEIREEVLDQSKLERLPSLSASLTEGMTNTKHKDAAWTGNYDLSAGMVISQGGQINQTIKQNELQYEQSKLQTAQYDNELTIQILQSFLTVLGNEELLRYQQSLVKMSESQMAEGKERFAVGQILESDYLLLEAQYATDRDNMLSTRINRENSLIALKSLMSMDLSQPLELIYPDTTSMEMMLLMPSVDEVVERTLTTLPDVGISQYKVSIAETGLKISKSALYPTVSLSGSIGTGHTNNFQNFGNQLSNKFSQQAGLTVSIPIFNKGRTRSNVNQSRIALQQAELDQMQTLMNVEQTILNEYGNVVAAGSKYKASEIRQNAYLRSFEAYNQMFQAGSITTVELLQQQNNYISAMNDYIQNKYSFMLERKILDVYIGEPIKM